VRVKSKRLAGATAPSQRRGHFIRLLDPQNGKHLMVARIWKAPNAILGGVDDAF
jgi:hypothetical protein